MIGQTLSHYRVTAALGAGGMGEVYRATDSNLGRDVAIKVLPPEVARDKERLSRFRREAHLLAALNHPNVASIYGLEEADGQPFLVLELVEGEDLRQRLDRGPIPLDEALEIAEQVAEALEEAHAKGIVHRDLKPANVKVAPDGKVKVLDFGLAKAWAGDATQGSASEALSQSPTLARTGTMAGVILGTAAYMSPEQARGRPVDKRADVWSFGVLLWEMLTGRSLFAGDTVTDILASVVKDPPDLEALPPETPPLVTRLVERCLRKELRQRLPDMGAARLELQDLLSGAGIVGAEVAASSESATPSGVRSSAAWPWVGLAGVLATLLLALGWIHFREAPPAPPPTAHFVVDAPDGWALFDQSWSPPSPDGSQVVFRAGPSGSAQQGDFMLWLRPLRSPTARVLMGTEGAHVVSWAPDGKSIAFLAEDELRRLELATGAVQRICSLPGPQFAGGTWQDDGTIVFVGGTQLPDTLYQVRASGGEPRVLLKADEAKGEATLLFPQSRPGGTLAFLVGGPREGLGGFYAAPMGSLDDRRLVAEGVRRVEYVGDHAFFASDGTLFAQRLGADGVSLAGEPVAIASDVATWPGAPGLGLFWVSPGGTLAYLTEGDLSGTLQLTWVDRKGNPMGAIGKPGDYGQIALSPDGRQVALELQTEDAGWDIWVMDVARGVRSRVTTGEGDERNPVWSRDGRTLTFSQMLEQADGGGDIRRKGLRAGDSEDVIADTPGLDYPEAWSGDGRTLLFINRSGPEADAEQSVWATSSQEGGDPTPVLDAGFFVDEPQLSPGDRWLAYTSHESGRSEVYVERFRAHGERVRISVEGGGQPKWRADGRELFFTDLTGMVMAVGFGEIDGRPEVDLPIPLFQIATEGPDYDDYAPSADGQRFVVKRVEGGRPAAMHVITNWQSLVE